MGREHALPKPLARLSRRQTPVVALLFAALLTLLLGLLPFAALGWLALGVIGVGVLRARRPASLPALGQVFLPDEELASQDRLG
jgi:hypothetical protein